MSKSNRNQSGVTAFGPKGELLVHRDGRMSVAPAIRRNLTVAKSLNEAALETEDRILSGTYSKDYSLDYQSSNFVRHDEDLGQATGNIENEIAVLWLCCNSEHIVHLRTVYQANPTVHPTLTMRCVAGVSLHEMIRDRPVIAEDNVKMCIRDIVRALVRLHSFNIAHLDLKPLKVLLLGGRFGEGVKLCGFRFARMMHKRVVVERDLTIDPVYKAPEMVRGDAVSLATDIWSVGVIAYVMLMGRLPFFSASFKYTLENILQHPFTGPIAFIDSLRRHMSPQAVDFIHRCTIQQTQSDRLMVEQCLAHPWLADAPDPLWMLRTLADVCATVSPASANQPSSHEQERQPVADLHSAATGERDRVRARGGTSGLTSALRQYRHRPVGRPTASNIEPRAEFPDTELPPP